MSLVSLLNSEPIAGYKVTARLGAGGYGEVWKAEAPGGLSKAIKFIYGFLTDEKAARELNALNRIKQIRHPFLLSLERIEVVDGQLMIVTELADMSLKDRFAACTEAGMPAIPREELLGYLRDAADALDFLTENSLQHLDVKPENLLLVGGRVKVADFGLVREIQDRTCSMMGGMTPVYAAPESFDGRPNAFSDQYSLAIVYQEMLTGVLPFPGATAAQLASQHLHSRPRLESLPPCDQPIVERALSKQGSERFKNCRTLIDTLLAAGRGAATNGVAREGAPASLADRETASDDGQDTDAPAAGRGRLTPMPERRTPVARLRRTPEKGIDPDVPPAEARTKTAPPAHAQPVVDLPPLQVPPDEVGLRPTLFVGIGGTGSRVLAQWRRRLEDRFGSLAQVPIWQSLLIDIDCRTFAQQSPGGSTRQQGAGETLAMPLRKPQEYRADSLDILQWLSRRWLFNIPRSLQTEGFRPLGRLALVDHARPLFDRLRKLIAAATSDEAAAQSQNHTGGALRSRAPRAFVVASIAGGTGSGMAIEVAYAVRMLLAEQGLPDNGVSLVLVHSTERKATTKSLAIANAYACLSELSHYARCRYPGEPACGLPPLAGEQARLPATYFVHLGDNLNEADYAHATDALAEYLYLDSATAAGAFFDRCRAEESAAASPAEVLVRTCGVHQLAAAQYELAKSAAEAACHQLLERWTSGPKKGAAPSAEARVDSVVQRVAAELKLAAPALLAVFQAAVDRVLQPSRSAAIERLARFALHEPEEANAPSYEQRWRLHTQLLEQMLGLTDPREADFDSPPVVDLPASMDAECKQMLESLGDRLSHEVFSAVDDAELRLPGALKVSEKLVALLRGLESELVAEQRQQQEQVAALAQPPAEAPASRRAAKTGQAATLGPPAIAKRLVAHGELLADQQASGAALRLARGLIHRLSSLGDSLAGMRRDLAVVAREFVPRSAATTPGAVGAADGSAGDVARAIAKELDTRMASVFAKLEKRVDREILAPAGGLARLMTGTADDVQRLPGLLRTAARGEVSLALRQIDIAQIVLGPAVAEGANHGHLGRGVEKARPLPLQCGGAKRLLLVMPTCESAAQLTALVEQEQQEHVSVVHDSDCDVVACYEAERLPLAAVAGLIAHGDPTCAEAARRLHTRVDVQWSAL